MAHKTGCLICGSELEYFESAGPATCFYCGAARETLAACVKGHYVCDACHSAGANDLIEQYCGSATSADPFALAETLMRHPAVKMHGPEHHFLVPAVLLAAYFNQRLIPVQEKLDSIRQARKRAEVVTGGFCGFQGACGAAIGTGIFISVISKCTPLSRAEWGLSNRMTAESLGKIAENEGPRCCKRDSFFALFSAVEFLEREFGVKIPANYPAVCAFDAFNKECHKAACPFYRS
jgi:hypothetical protein